MKLQELASDILKGKKVTRSLYDKSDSYYKLMLVINGEVHEIDLDTVDLMSDDWYVKSD